MEQETKTTFGSKLVRVLHKVRFVIIGVASLGLLVALGMFIFERVTEARMAEATSSLEKIEALYETLKSTADEAEKTKKVDEFKAAVAAIETSKPGNFHVQRALFLMGEYYATEKKYAEAIEFFTKAEAVRPKTYLGAIALFNKAIMLEQDGKQQDASVILEGLVTEYKTLSVEVPRVYMNLARIAEKQGDYKKASDYYTQVTVDYPESDWTKIAKDRIIFLKTENKL